MSTYWHTVLEAACWVFSIACFIPFLTSFLFAAGSEPIPKGLKLSMLIAPIVFIFTVSYLVTVGATR